MSVKLPFDISLQKTKLIFRLTGINIVKEKRTIKENILYAFNFLVVNIGVFSAMIFVYTGLQKEEGLEELVFVTPCAILCSLGTIKAFFFILTEKKVRDLIANLRALEDKANQFNKEADEEIKEVDPDIKFLNNVIRVLSIQTVLMAGVFQVIPIVVIAVKYIMTGKLTLLLPALDVYPFIDAYEPRYWPFAYFQQLWAELVILLEINSADFFFFICCTHIRIQFKLLQLRFQEFIESSSIFAEREDQAIVREKFKVLIVWHQEILSSAKMLEDIYSKPCLWNFLLSSVIICLTGFNITIFDQLAFVVTSVIFLSMSLLQVFFLCLFGDSLMTSVTADWLEMKDHIMKLLATSMEFSDAVYNSKWYFCDVTMGKNVLLVQMRSQDSCKVTAAGFADVNLRAFMRVLNASWSYLALLRTIYSARA